jgi:hypothetical protein
MYKSRRPVEEPDIQVEAVSAFGLDAGSNGLISLLVRFMAVCGLRGRHIGSHIVAFRHV